MRDPGSDDAPVSGLQGPGGEAGQWRPIESAPRDGTVVLLWAQHWRAASTGWTFGEDAWQDCPKDAYVRPPTLWQPLPEPPK